MVLFIIVPIALHALFGRVRSIAPLSGQYLDQPTVSYTFVAFGFAILLTGLLTGHNRHSRELPTKHGEPTGATEITGFLRPYFGTLVITGAALWVVASGMSAQELLTASRFQWFTASPTFSPAALVATTYLTAAIAPFVFHLTRNPGGRLFGLLVLLTLAGHSLLSGDRKWILMVVSAWIASKYDRSGQRLSVSTKQLAALALAAALLVISQPIRDVGKRLLADESVDIVAEYQQWASRTFEYGDVSYFYRASLEAIDQHVNKDLGYPLALPSRILLFFVPSGMTGGLKSEDISARFSDAIGGEDAIRRGNMPPGFFGLFVLSFGPILSVPILIWIVIAIRRLDSLFVCLRGPIRDSTISIYSFSVLMAMRGDESSAVYYTISNILLTVAGVTVAVVMSKTRHATAVVHGAGAIRYRPTPSSMVQ